MTRKFTTEELSRILSAHAARQLRRRGAKGFGLDSTRWGVGCIAQVAFNDPDKGHALRAFPKAAWWFDTNYRSDMRAETLLHELERRGWRDGQALDAGSLSSVWPSGAAV